MDRVRRQSMTMTGLKQKVAMLALVCRTGPRAWQAPGEKENETFNTWRLLADVERVVNEDGRWVLVIDDVRRAFDNVNIDLVLAILGRHIHEPTLLGLIEV